jgi:prophage antirepressor-like protein
MTTSQSGGLLDEDEKIKVHSMDGNRGNPNQTYVTEPGLYSLILRSRKKGISNVYTPGGTQRLTIINEPGLYSLILRSRKPEAKAFKQ